MKKFIVTINNGKKPQRFPVLAKHVIEAILIVSSFVDLSNGGTIKGEPV